MLDFRNLIFALRRAALFPQIHAHSLHEVLQNPRTVTIVLALQPPDIVDFLASNRGSTVAVPRLLRTIEITPNSSSFENWSTSFPRPAHFIHT